MTRQNNTTRTVQDKCNYYAGRVNDPKLSEAQRNYAQRRLNQLCSGGKSNSSSNVGKTYTDGQKAAFTAGRVYGMAKSGKRVPVRPENQSSFRAGVERERGKNNTRPLL